MNQLLKSFIPPIIFLLRRKMLDDNYSLAQKIELWSGNYATWSEAKSLCKGYEVNLILEKCKNSLLEVKNGKAVYERDSVLFDEIQYSWGLLAGLQKSAIDNNNKLCVLDFGGSLGTSYYQNKDFLSGLKSIEWCIVEQSHFVDCGKINFENDQLKFYHTIEECLSLHKPNVILLSGVLQYLENPNQWIESFLKAESEYIILDRTAFVDNDNDILTIQNVPESIYESSYPAWFFNQKKLINKFIGYDVVADFGSSYDPINYNLNNGINANWNGVILKRIRV